MIVIAIAIAGLAFEQETVEVLGDTGTQAITSRLKDADRPREGHLRRCFVSALWCSRRWASSSTEARHEHRLASCLFVPFLVRRPGYDENSQSAPHRFLRWRSELADAGIIRLGKDGSSSGSLAASVANHRETAKGSLPRLSGRAPAQSSKGGRSILCRCRLGRKESVYGFNLLRRARRDASAGHLYK